MDPENTNVSLRQSPGKHGSLGCTKHDVSQRRSVNKSNNHTGLITLVKCLVVVIGLLVNFFTEKTSYIVNKRLICGERVRDMVST